MNYAEYITGEASISIENTVWNSFGHKVADALHENILPRKDRSHVVSVEIYGYLYGQLPTNFMNKIITLGSRGK